MNRHVVYMLNVIPHWLANASKLSISLWVIALGTLPSTAYAQNPGGGVEFVEGEILVTFRAGMQTAQVASVQKALGASTAEVLLEGDIHQWKLPPGRSVVEAIKALFADPTVEHAQPNYIYRMARTPNDPSFGRLWGLNNTGQTGGIPQADIDAPKAWDYTTGSPNVIVAVIDTGVDYNHADLKDNIWTNPAEIPGNGIDDDGNGYIDDIHGINAITNSGNPMDDNYHGTHVAGTVGAKGGNGIGVAGVAWDVRIVACKFLNQSGSGTTANAVKCFRYLNRLKKVSGQNVLVSNNSWGGGSYDQDLYQAMAGLDQPGMEPILHVCAAGNSGTDNDVWSFYPPSYHLDNIISVAATDASDRYAYFSNYGAASVDIAAPGVDIYSTSPGGGYRTLSGTSMAAPHLTGAAALIWSAYPQLTAAQIKQRILASADDISYIPANTSKPTVTNGRLNVASALLGARHRAVITDLGTLGGLWSEARDINEAGQVVGESQSADGYVRAFRWDSASGMEDLGWLDPWFTQAGAYGINNLGQIVGWSGPLNGPHAFLWTPGGTDGVPANPQMKDLRTLGAGASWRSMAYDINDASHVVGWSDTDTFRLEHAFLWTPGGTDGPPHNPQMKDLGTLGGDDSAAWGINNSGQIAGWAHFFPGFDSDEGRRAALWDGSGGIHPIGGLLGGYLDRCTTAWGMDINEAGQIIGPSTLITAEHPIDTCSPTQIDAFLWTPGATNGVPSNPEMKDLGTLGGTVSDALGINNTGQVVGYSRLPGTDAYHAVVWDNALITDMNDLLSSHSGWVLQEARAINDQRWVVGNGLFRGQKRGFLLGLGTPDADSDGDGIPDSRDNAPDIYNPDQADGDNDGVGDVADNCPQVANSDQADMNGDSIGEACSDCNNNGFPDLYDIEAGVAMDCNRNSVLDECELAQCTGDPACQDCNHNGELDACDLMPPTSGFTMPVDYVLKNYTTHVAAGDLDNDGDIDLATVDYQSPCTTGGSVVVLLNKGGGAFADPVEYPAGDCTGDLALADLDGDGALDLVVTHYAQNAISVLLNHGNGSFGPPVNYTVGTYPYFAAAGDLDGDGDIDLVTANLGDWQSFPAHDGSVSVLLNNGNGTFAAPVNYVVGTSTQSLTLADLDRDGDLDIATVNYGWDYGLNGPVENAANILLNGGHGTFTRGGHYGVGAQPVSIAAADLDADGDTDLITANRSNSISVLRNSGAGAFSAAQSYGTLSDPRQVLAVDMDSDGDRDIVVKNYSGVTVFWNDGDPAFPNVTSYALVGFGLAVADLDSDGTADIAAAVPGYPGRVSVMFNNGSGPFAAPVQYAFGAPRGSVAIADLDGDGDLDLITPSRYPGNALVATTLFNRGNGEFTIGVDYPVGGSGYPVAVTVGDFDRDGDVDAATSSGNVVSVLMNSGDGSFAPAVRYTRVDPYQFFYRDLKAADLDADGDLDLVATGQDPNGAGAVAILLNTGDGTFTNGPSLLVGTYNPKVWTFVNDLGVVDLDADGYLDIAVTTEDIDVTTEQAYQASLTVLRNRRDGSFASGVSYPIEPVGWYSLTAGDLDADGDIDLVTAGSADQGQNGTISIFLNDGKGRLQAPLAYPVQSLYLNSITAADVDADGDLDLAAIGQDSANYNEGMLLIMLNRGDATFSSPRNYRDGRTLWSIASGDLNGDGDADLVTVALNDYTIAVIESRMYRGDCNFNGVPDKCDLASGYSADANRNGVPDECELMPGDLDGDFDLLSACMRGPDVAPPQGCTRADLDFDGDVDLADFAAFQIVFTGP